MRPGPCPFISDRTRNACALAAFAETSEAGVAAQALAVQAQAAAAAACALQAEGTATEASKRAEGLTREVKGLAQEVKGLEGELADLRADGFEMAQRHADAVGGWRERETHSRSEESVCLEGWGVKESRESEESG